MPTAKILQLHSQELVMLVQQVVLDHKVFKECKETWVGRVITAADLKVFKVSKATQELKVLLVSKEQTVS